MCKNGIGDGVFALEFGFCSVSDLDPDWLLGDESPEFIAFLPKVGVTGPSGTVNFTSFVLLKQNKNLNHHP